MVSKKVVRHSIVGIVFVLAFLAVYSLINIAPIAKAAYFESADSYSLIFSNITRIELATSNLTQGVTFIFNITNNGTVAREYNLSVITNGSSMAFINGSSVVVVRLGNKTESNSSIVLNVTVNGTSSETVGVIIKVILETNSSIYMNSSQEKNIAATLDNIPPSIVINSPRNTTYYLGGTINQTVYINASASDLLSASSVSIWANNGTANLSATGTVGLNLTNGTYTLEFFANDSLNNWYSINLTFGILTLPSTNMLISEFTTAANSTMSTVVWPFEYNNVSEISSNKTSTDAVYIDLSQRVSTSGNATLSSQNHTLKRIGASTNYTVEFLAGTVVSGGAGWNGSTFIFPTEATASVTSPALTGYTTTTRLAIRVGDSVELNLSKPAKIVLQGMANKSAAWGTGTTLTNISTLCVDANNYSNIYSNMSPRECQFTSSNDLIIWSYHLSYFAAYNRTVVVSSGDDDDDNGGGDDDDDACVEDDDCDETPTEYWLNSTSKTGKELSEYKEINVSLRAREKINFKVESKTRYLGVISLTSSSVKVNISTSGKPITYTFAKGEIKNFELTGDTYYDVQVELNALGGSRANFTIAYIHLSNGTNSSSNNSLSLNRSIGSSNASRLDGDNESALTAGSTGGSGISSGAKIFLIVFGIVLLLSGGGVTGYFYLRKYYQVRNLASKVKVKVKDSDYRE